MNKAICGLMTVLLSGCVHATWLGAPGSGGGSALEPARTADVPLELYVVRASAVFPEKLPQPPLVAAPAPRPRPVPVKVEAEDEDLDGETAAAPAGMVEAEEDGEVEGSEDPSAPRYTAELDDETLARKFKQDPGSLGSLSLGLVGQGRMMNASRFPAGATWTLTTPHAAYATQETIGYIITAVTEVARQFPGATPLRINGLSSRDGGRLRPHKSHQNGRDVDLGFYYPGETVRARARERVIDPAKNWALIKAIVTLTDVQMILVDKRIQRVLYEYAQEQGEDQAWLDSVFKGSGAIVKHARRHRDHFHVRFFNPRAQELGRRVAPLLGTQVQYAPPRRHKVRRGETLAVIARKYNTSAEHLANMNNLRAQKVGPGQVLRVPGKSRVVRLPVPPPVVVPPRRLPPEMRRGPEVASLSVVR